MASRAVLFEQKGLIGLVTLNQPDTGNRMSPELLDTFSEVMDQVAAVPALRAVVIGANGRCFSAGADLDRSLQRSGAFMLPHQASYAMYEPFLKVLDLRVPVVAALTGHTVGGGFGLSLLADIRVAARGIQLGANFAKLGIHSGLGISYTLPQLVGRAKAAELLFTGRLVNPEEALAIGLVNEVVAPEQTLNRALAIAEEIAAASPIAVPLMKATMRGDDAERIREHARKEAALQAETLTTEDAKEGIAAMLDKRVPQFKGR